MVNLRVVVSQRVDYIESRDEMRDSLDSRFVLWLSHVGAQAFPVPNSLLALDALGAWLNLLSPDAVVLSGGNNIGDYPERDATEEALLDYAAFIGLPVLGICRGMQMMAQLAGSELERVEGHVAGRHRLVSDAPNDLPAEVNSFHEWRLATCPEEYLTLARTADGSIEAIRHRRYGWEGWMWHPERDTEFDPLSIARAQCLLRGEPTQ